MSGYTDAEAALGRLRGRVGHLLGYGPEGLVNHAGDGHPLFGAPESALRWAGLPELRNTRLLEETRYLARSLLERQEQERKALAWELHDQLGQRLAALRLEVAAGARCGGTGLPETGTGTLLELTAELYDVVYRLMNRLRPDLLDTLGLEETLRHGVAGWQARHRGVRCVLRIHGSDGPWPEAAATAVYRAVEECLANVERHAAARRVQIRLWRALPGSRRALGRREPCLHLVVRDDGRGLGQAGDPAAPGAGVGLLGMRERARALGGDCYLRSRPGRGLRVHLVLPL